MTWNNDEWKGCKRISDLLSEELQRPWQERAKWGPYDQKFTLVDLREAKKNRHHRTCFQRMCPKSNGPAASMRRRSTPLIMMRSNTTSVTSELITEGLVVSKLSRPQVFVSGDHLERIYGYQINLAYSKTVEFNICTRTTPVALPRIKDIPSWSAICTHRWWGMRRPPPIHS